MGGAPDRTVEPAAHQIHHQTRSCLIAGLLVVPGRRAGGRAHAHTGCSAADKLDGTQDAIKGEFSYRGIPAISGGLWGGSLPEAARVSFPGFCFFSFLRWSLKNRRIRRI